MQSVIVSIMAIASVALAAPSEIDARTYNPACPQGLYSVPQCCATDVLGAADLNCEPPKSLWNFKESCPENGSKAMCCVLPVAGQGVLCVAAV
ncbi:beta ketoadipyl CoA thiolase, th1 [Claviceps africana]|uniref:Beta ketoadipyl CoA thiolase, th1 n=1 Tax=Claviceps africana TaxID=83212 RepID=A0A8K0NFI7_9HYPO|nr:beta ketoadipyl CoA thiolase, th1 [Claviceps africana]